MIEYELVKEHQDNELSAEEFQRLMSENVVNPEDLTPEERVKYFKELAQLEAEDPSQPHMPEADIPEANRVPPPFNEPRKPKLDDDPSVPPVTKMLLKAFSIGR